MVVGVVVLVVAGGRVEDVAIVVGQVVEESRVAAVVAIDVLC